MVWSLLLSLGVAALGCSERGTEGSAEQADTAPFDGPVAAAEALCPVMWTWVKAVGEAFNEASHAVSQVDDAEGRREEWMNAFDRIEALDRQLLTDVAIFRDDPILAPVIAEIERDMPLSLAELDDIRALFAERPELDEERHQARTSQVIVGIEKVIDLPKPSLAPLDTDGTLIPAFQSVPSCQQSIKDVDDGSTQANG